MIAKSSGQIVSPAKNKGEFYSKTAHPVEVGKAQKKRSSISFHCCWIFKWALRDLNPRPPRCKRGALAN